MSLPDELSVLGHTVAHFLLKSSKILFIFSPPFSLDLLSQKSNSLDDGNNVWATLFIYFYKCIDMGAFELNYVAII